MSLNTCLTQALIEIISPYPHLKVACPCTTSYRPLTSSTLTLLQRKRVREMEWDAIREMRSEQVHHHVLPPPPLPAPPPLAPLHILHNPLVEKYRPDISR